MYTSKEEANPVDENLQKSEVKLEEVESNNSQISSSSTSFFKTCFNGMNALSGVGILSVPYAVSSGGWLSLILLLVVAIAAFNSGLLIQRCMDKNSDIKTFPEIGQLAFGKKGKMAVSISMYAELYLVATGFLILEGDNLNNLLPNLGFRMMGLNISGQPFFVILVGLIILPSLCVDNMNLLSYVSASGVLASAVIIGSIFWTGASTGIGFRQKGKLIDWKGIPTSISLYAFCYGAHPVFPTLYTSMKNKPQFSNILLLCFVLCTIGYASMAVMGYTMFGSDIRSQITLNLPKEKLSSRVEIYTALANPICKYALMVKPIVVSMKSWFPCYNTKRPFFLTLLVGTSLLISNVVVAISVPFFADLMSLVGAFLCVTASIILPCLCYLKISGTYRSFSFETAVIVSMILMGGAVAVIGTYTSLAQIIKRLTQTGPSN